MDPLVPDIDPVLREMLVQILHGEFFTFFGRYWVEVDDDRENNPDEGRQERIAQILTVEAWRLVRRVRTLFGNLEAEEYIPHELQATFPEELGPAVAFLRVLLRLHFGDRADEGFQPEEADHYISDESSDDDDGWLIEAIQNRAIQNPVRRQDVVALESRVRNLVRERQRGLLSDHIAALASPGLDGAASGESNNPWFNLETADEFYWPNIPNWLFSHRRAPKPAATCGICYRRVKILGPSEQPDLVELEDDPLEVCTVLQCGHIYGDECIAAWLRTKYKHLDELNQVDQIQCPVCKGKF